MTYSPPLLPTGVPYPIWNPGPRKPRHYTRWLALLSAAVAVTIAALGAQRIFGADYTARDDACATLDLSPLAQALGEPSLRATPRPTPPPPIPRERRNARSAGSGSRTPPARPARRAR